MNPNKQALIGFLFATPFIFLNLIISLRIEPIYSFLGSFTVIRSNPIIPLLLILLLPIGAFIAFKPVVHKNKDGKRKFYIINIVVASLLLMLFLPVFVALGEEFYRCNILNIPNCD